MQCLGSQAAARKAKNVEDEIPCYLIQTRKGKVERCRGWWKEECDEPPRLTTESSTDGKPKVIPNCENLVVERKDVMPSTTVELLEAQSSDVVCQELASRLGEKESQFRTDHHSFIVRRSSLD